MMPISYTPETQLIKTSDDILWKFSHKDFFFFQTQKKLLQLKLMCIVTCLADKIYFF